MLPDTESVLVRLASRLDHVIDQGLRDIIHSVPLPINRDLELDFLE